MQRKKIIIILLIVALIIGGTAFYLFYFKKLPALPFGLTGGEEEQKIPSSITEVISDEKLKRISTEGAISPIIAADNSRVRYIGGKGDIFEVRFDGSLVQRVPFTLLQDLVKVVWTKDRETFAALYGGTEKKKFFFYDLDKKQMTPYASTVTALALSEMENKLAYHSTAGLADTPLIAVADPDGNNAKTVLQARMRGVDLAWVSENEIAVSTIPSGLAPNMLWLLNTASSKLASVLSDIYGLTVRWAPSGEAFLFGQTNTQGKGLSLSISNKNGTTIKPLSITTLPEKCVFAHDEKSIVCAVPQVLPDIIWPDDYYKKLYIASEQIWRIDLVSGKQDLLYEFGTSLFNASELILSPQEDVVLFVNRENGELYSLAIK